MSTGISVRTCRNLLMIIPSARRRTSGKVNLVARATMPLPRSNYAHYVSHVGCKGSNCCGQSVCVRNTQYVCFLQNSIDSRDTNRICSQAMLHRNEAGMAMSNLMLVLMSYHGRTGTMNMLLNISDLHSYSRKR